MENFSSHGRIGDEGAANLHVGRAADWLGGHQHWDVLGLAGCEALRHYEFPLDTDVYYVDTLPVVVHYETVGVVAVVAVLICFLATLYPATIAARIRPVDGLRYE